MFIIHSLNTAKQDKKKRKIHHNKVLQEIQYKYKLRFAQIEIFVILFFFVVFYFTIKKKGHNLFFTLRKTIKHTKFQHAVMTLGNSLIVSSEEQWEGLEDGRWNESDTKNLDNGASCRSDLWPQVSTFFSNGSSDG